MKSFFKGSDAYDKDFLQAHPEITGKLYATLIGIYILKNVFHMHIAESKLILRKAKSYLKKKGIQNHNLMIYNQQILMLGKKDGKSNSVQDHNSLKAWFNSNFSQVESILEENAEIKQVLIDLGFDMDQVDNQAVVKNWVSRLNKDQVNKILE